MQSRFYINIALFVFVLLIALLAINTENVDETVEILTHVHPESIDNIIIKHNEKAIVIINNDGNWKIRKPVTINANNFRINSILKILSTPSKAKYNAKIIDLKKYGLDKPDTSISFDSVQIDFGSTNMKGHRYVLVNDYMHLIDDNFYPLVSSNIGTLVARELVSIESEIVSLALPDRTLSKNSQQQWESTKNDSTSDVSEIIYNWQTSQAFGVHVYNKKESIDEVLIHLKNVEKPVKFLITDIEPWLVLARPDKNIEYHFTAEFYNRLFRPGVTDTIPDEFLETN